MKKGIIREIISDLLIVVAAIAVVFILNNYVLDFVIISGSSMEDTLHENDAGFSFYYDLNDIERFDIVIVDNGEGKELIKRVVGLPFEEIEYKDNKLYVNGEYIEEDFLNESTITEDFNIVLNNDEYFCLGDNREISNDSRNYGPFNKESIISSHIFRFFPFNRIGFIQ